jgi:hypothetical protein
MLQASASDYLSKVAFDAGIGLEQFLLDNSETIKDLDASLAGRQLLLCTKNTGGSGGSSGDCALTIAYKDL